MKCKMIEESKYNHFCSRSWGLSAPQRRYVIRVEFQNYNYNYNYKLKV